MNFNSQICTTKEQSERLLALGLKKETADMVYKPHSHYPDEVINYYEATPMVEPLRKYIIADDIDFRYYIPAWSLHRLIEMMPTYINVAGDEWTLNILQGKLIAYTNDEKNDFLFSQGAISLYDSIIIAIECLIQAGHFNEKYLNEV